MKKIALTGASLAFAGVALGAFGAHALKDRLAEAGTTEIWRTAVLYHLVHAIAIWAAGGLALLAPAPSKALVRAAWLWVAGVVLFSGSLYGLALGGPRWMGPITPLGGACFLAGWVFAALASARLAATRQP